MWDPNLCKHEGNREMLKQRGNTVYQNISNTWLLRKLCITVVSFFFFRVEAKIHSMFGYTFFKNTSFVRLMPEIL